MTNDELIGGEPWEGGGEVSSAVREDEPLPPVYDLEERTARFGESVIDFCAVIPLGPRTNRLVDQLTGCGTSLGGNYCEADDALSKKGLCQNHWHLPQGSARDEILSADDRPCLPRPQIPSPPPLAGGK